MSGSYASNNVESLRSDAMIEVNELTKRYGSELAEDGVSFRCEPGTITGVLGRDGAGNSTTLRMITGLTPPTAAAVVTTLLSGGDPELTMDRFFIVSGFAAA